MKTIDERVRALEHGCVLPGTQITRVTMDNTLCRRYKIRVRDAVHDSQVIWCVAVGHMCHPKTFFYGGTINEALRRAEQARKEAVNG